MVFRGTRHQHLSMFGTKHRKGIAENKTLGAENFGIEVCLRLKRAA
jgi:hypothetical protein